MGLVSCGIDEAGRGPVIGPLVLACAVFDEDGRKRIAQLGVRDSKKVSPGRRYYLAPLIREAALECRTVKIHAGDIDRIRKRMSLNQMEAEYTAKLILSCETRIDRAIIDATDSIADNYLNRIRGAISGLNGDYLMPEFVCEHKADDRYLEVSAASIVAKVERDSWVEHLKASVGDFGSGYPSDPATQEFLKRLKAEGDYPEYVRKSWSTVAKDTQKSLTEY